MRGRIIAQHFSSASTYYSRRHLLGTGHAVASGARGSFITLPPAAMPPGARALREHLHRCRFAGQAGRLLQSPTPLVSARAQAGFFAFGIVACPAARQASSASRLSLLSLRRKACAFEAIGGAGACLLACDFWRFWLGGVKRD